MIKKRKFKRPTCKSCPYWVSDDKKKNTDRGIEIGGGCHYTPDLITYIPNIGWSFPAVGENSSCASHPDFNEWMEHGDKSNANMIEEVRDILSGDIDKGNTLEVIGKIIDAVNDNYYERLKPGGSWEEKDQ